MHKTLETRKGKAMPAHSAQPNNTHLQRPHPPDPHLQLSLDPIDALELNALPPASPCGLAPEEEEFLCHANGVAAHFAAADVSTETSEREGADDGFVGLVGAVTPVIVVVEASIGLKLVHLCPMVGWQEKGGHTQQSTSQSNAAQWFLFPRFSVSQRRSHLASTAPSQPLS